MTNGYTRRVKYVFLVAVAALALVGHQSAASAAGVVIKSPRTGATVSGNVTITTAVGFKVVWINMYIDGQYLFSSPPYTFTWDSTSVSNGPHTISSAAFNSNDKVIGSSAIRVTVNNSGKNFSTQSSPASAISSNGSVSNAPSYFSTLPPGATLPSGQQCAQWVRSASSTETESANASANQTIPNSSDLSSFHSQPLWNNEAPASDFAAVDGNFNGTTDQILRWAACKWGLDENAMRAEAWQETNWIQSTTGDWRSDESLCQTPGWDGWNGSGCYQSYGILQAKVFDYNVWPFASASTAFNADFRAAYQRACMNGDINYLGSQNPSDYPTYPNGTTDEMFWGCMGQWFSGGWYDSGGQSYVGYVQEWLSSQPWPH